MSRSPGKPVPRELAEDYSNAFAALNPLERVDVLAFLRRLRTPKSVAKDILPQTP